MPNATTIDWAQPEEHARHDLRRRNLLGACLAHLLHDGYTDQLYALLPVWQTEFGLSYAGLALVRALYSCTMGGLQVPVTRLLAGLSPRLSLVLATVIAACGYAIMALPFGFTGLCIGLVVSGMGSSIQHPRASLLVTSSYGKNARGPLGIYNFAGDLGKAIFPAAVALLLPLFAWRLVVGISGLIGLLIAVGLLALVPPQPVVQVDKAANDSGGDGRGFARLLTIGAFDTATRMGYLLFLPFLLESKGGTEATLGFGLALLFAGGALGKAFCGWLGQYLGVVASVIVTEAATAALVIATLLVPLTATLVLLPLLGIVLNGTSSVLYGTVPELAKKGEVGKAFALFYTGVIGAGGISPIAYGIIADHFGRTAGIVAAGLTAAVIIPMVLSLRSVLGKH